MKIAYGVVSIILGLAWTVAAAEPLKPVVLPAPQMDKGRPLMSVLNDRQSRRDISPSSYSTFKSAKNRAIVALRACSLARSSSKSMFNWSRIFSC